MKRATVLIIFLSIMAVAWLPVPKRDKSSIRLKTLTSTIKSDTSAVIHVVVDNGEREREFDIRCTIWPDSLVLQGVFAAYYYNYSKTFTATIPIK